MLYFMHGADVDDSLIVSKTSTESPWLTPHPWETHRAADVTVVGYVSSVETLAIDFSLEFWLSR